ncbi:aspartate/glutamate racemase family protein [Paraburkholderia lacunae]|uniref:Aspartate racemase n=1 Tax=Paraburkholderia lacunae TaxID=2211104 RepID=A0A370N576_9BURK|nr:amino acid racemase [Paraburkholderia lacunae]RDK00757.1 aspartate racemase [Paraburkholderia lacunae]
MAMIGILGGMGPLATVDFMERIIQLTSTAGALCDQQHLPLLVANLPHIPDRSEAMLGVGEDPLPALLDGIDMLNRNGVELIAVPCNSAHYWYDAMRARSGAPMLHIAETCVAAMPPGTRCAAVLATGGTLHSGLYQRVLAARDIVPVVPDEGTQQNLDACIHAVKAGDLARSAEYLRAALLDLEARGAEAAVMGCTEIPLAARHLKAPAMTLVDSTLELARATVSYGLSRGWNVRR